jgi:hypothetical protein
MRRKNLIGKKTEKTENENENEKTENENEKT